MVQPRVAVRLVDRDHAARGGLAGGFQNGCNLHRVVTIIVNDRDPLNFAHAGKAPVNAAELGQRLAYLIRLHPQMAGHGDGGQRVGDVVIAGHGQAAPFDHAVFGLQSHVEMGHAGIVAQVQRPDVRLCVEPIGDHAAVGDFAHQRLDVRIIGAAHGHAVKRDVGDEIEEPLVQRRFGPPMLHMFGIDIGHDGDGGGQTVESAVALVRLNDHPLALALAGVGAVGVDDATVHHRRVKLALVQQGGDHRGGRGFAMGARDGDVGFEAHEFCQHLSPAHDGQATGAGGVQFGIAGLDGRRDHDDLGVFDILRALPFENQRAEISQTIGDFGALEVGALHDIAVVEQHFGDARHADAADADKVNGAHVSGQFGGGVHVVPFSARVSTIATRLSVASGLPALCAAWAICNAPSGLSRTIMICWAMASTLSWLSGIRMAAPASTRPRALAVWWSPVAAAKGIRIEGLPMTEISASEEAPARAMINWASDMRRGTSWKKGWTSALMPCSA
mmetsp:Transcript_29190/g.56407  ORF Transcript_29190/g.56407 Transcript_29190/m.56407 type:complete len:504 (-) Transcript_29190:2619-4130(-)